MKIRFENREIPVKFLSADHKMIPQLIHALHTIKGADKQNGTFDFEELDRIEVVGTEAYLFVGKEQEPRRTYLALF
jgi:hypothetical protein